MAWLTPDEHQEKVEAARDIVLRRLDRSLTSRAALAELLARKEVEESVGEEVLDRLEAVGLIDDGAYAAMVARTRFAEKGASRRVIAQELSRKGIAGVHIEAALAQIDEDDEEEAARALLRKKVRSTRSLEPEVRKRRAIAFLARKGYAPSVAFQLFDELLREEAEEE